MNRLLRLLVVLGVGLAFWRWVPFGTLFPAFQPLTTTLSIFMAAVLVRLNRGMPTLEWKSLDPDRRSQLTGRIVAAVVDYVGVLCIIGVVLLSMLVLSTLTQPFVVANWGEPEAAVSSGLFGGILSLCLVRISLVVWRDVEIVKLQKQLIDASASKDSTEREIQSAVDKIVTIKATGLRKVAVSEPRAWVE